MANSDPPFFRLAGGYAVDYGSGFVTVFQPRPCPICRVPCGLLRFWAGRYRDLHRLWYPHVHHLMSLLIVLRGPVGAPRLVARGPLLVLPLA